MFEPTTVATRRKAYLALAKRRIRPGSGSSRRHLQRRTTDLTRMLGAADDETLKQVNATVAEYVPDAVEDVESMVLLGRMEYEP